MKNKSKKEMIEEIEILNQKLQALEKMQPFFAERKAGDISSQYITYLLDNAQESIGILQDETHKYVNKRASEIDGRPVEELIGKHMSITTHPDDYPVALQNYYRKLRGERVDKYRYRSFNKDGQVIWLDIIGTTILWEGRPAVLNFVTDVTQEVMAQEALKQSVEELKKKSVHLEEANTALKVLLQHRQNDQKEIEEKIFNNIKTLIIPYLDKLKATCLDAKQEAYVRILESHIDEIASPFMKRMMAYYANLTPRELQIADLVKDGKSTKEISEILNIALHTANNHRKRLRKKLSLKDKDENLRARLLTLI